MYKKSRPDWVSNQHFLISGLLQFFQLQSPCVNVIEAVSLCEMTTESEQTIGCMCPPFLLNLIMSWASSSLSQQDWRSFLIVSFNLCFGCARYLLPSTPITCTPLKMSSSLSRLRSCPNHYNLFLLLIRFNKSMTFSPCLMLTLVLCSSRLIPRQYRNIPIS